VAIAALAGVGVAIVADLAFGSVDDAVAAGLERQAVGRTAIAIDGVAVVADFAGIGVEHAVAAALFGFAVGGTTVAVEDVAVVAGLARIDDAVTATVADADRLHRGALQRVGAHDAARAFVRRRLVRARGNEDRDRNDD
jgi:hypothetical protein